MPIVQVGRESVSDSEARREGAFDNAREFRSKLSVMFRVGSVMLHAVLAKLMLTQ